MSGNIKYDKWINDDNSENYKCRAWVNFNGTGTVSIRASGGVSSISDNGTGNYTVNFTTAMEDANYSFSVSASAPAVADGFATLSTTVPTASTLRFRCFAYNGIAVQDMAHAAVAVFR